MQEVFFESPVMLAVIGLLTAGAAGLVWVQIGHKAALITAIAAAVLTVVLVLVCLQVTTDREQIRQILDDIATALEHNDYEGVYRYIHPNAVEGVTRAKNELPNYEFSEARVTHIKSIEVNRATQPPTAMAEFNVVVQVGIQGHKMRGARFVRVYFMQQAGKWLVRDYEHFEFTAGFRDTPLMDGPG